MNGLLLVGVKGLGHENTGANQMARHFDLQAHPLLPSLRAKAPAI